MVLAFEEDNDVRTPCDLPRLIPGAVKLIPLVVIGEQEAALRPPAICLVISAGQVAHLHIFDDVVDGHIRNAVLFWEAVRAFLQATLARVRLHIIFLRMTVALTPIVAMIDTLATFIFLIGRPVALAMRAFTLLVTSIIVLNGAHFGPTQPPKIKINFFSVKKRFQSLYYAFYHYSLPVESFAYLYICTLSPCFCNFSKNIR